MIGPHIRLIERVSVAFMQFHKEGGSPSPRLEGGTGYPRLVGLAVHQEPNGYSIMGFALREFSGTYH